MKRTLLFVLTITLLLLNACGGGRDEAALESFRAQMREAETISAHLTLHTEKTDYTLSCAQSGDETRLEVLSPEEIAGIRATVSGGALTLGYDSILLDAGTAGGKSPLTAFSRLVFALCEGWLKQVWREEQRGVTCLAGRFQIGNEDYVSVWLEEQTGAPLYAELDTGGKVVLSMVFDTWNLDDKGN